MIRLNTSSFAIELICTIFSNEFETKCLVRPTTSGIRDSLWIRKEVHPSGPGSEGDYISAAFLIPELGRAIHWCSVNFGRLLDAKPGRVQVLRSWPKPHANRSRFRVQFDELKLP